MIVVRLLLLALSLYGLSRLTMRRLKLPVEGALPLTMVSIATTVTLAGMINLLSEAVWLIWAAGLVLAVRSLWRRESLRAVLTPGTCFFAAGAVGLALLVRGARFYQYDDFGHWALVVRILFARDALPTFRDICLAHVNYPPGSACWVYFFCRLCGSESEDAMMFAQALMMLACFLPLMLLARRRPVTSFLTMAAVACYCLLASGTFLFSLYVDHLLPVVSAAGVLLVLSNLRQPRRAALLALPFSVYAYLIKNSGIFFSLLFSLLLVGIVLWNRRSRPVARRDWQCVAAVCVSPAVIVYLWNQHTSMVFQNASTSKHAMRPWQLLSTFLEKTSGEIREISSKFFASLAGVSVLPLLCLVLMAFCLWGVSARRHALYRPGLAALCGSAAVFAVYLVSLLLMYLFSMPTGEALVLASMDRYMSTIHLWMVFMTAATLLALLDACPPLSVRQQLASASAAVLAACSLLYFSGFPDPFVARFDQEFQQTERAKIEAAIQAQSVPSGQRYALAGMINGRLPFDIFQYLLSPAYITLNLEEWHDVDAIILYEPKPLEMVYIEETVLPSGEAPVIYDCR